MLSSSHTCPHCYHLVFCILQKFLRQPTECSSFSNYSPGGSCAERLCENSRPRPVSLRSFSAPVQKLSQKHKRAHVMGVFSVFRWSARVFTHPPDLAAVREVWTKVGNGPQPTFEVGVWHAWFQPQAATLIRRSVLTNPAPNSRSRQAEARHADRGDFLGLPRLHSMHSGWRFSIAFDPPSSSARICPLVKALLLPGKGLQSDHGRLQSGQAK